MFNHLKVPESWNSYFSKYPNGLTIMEALCDWVGQVDSMIDHINTVDEHIDYLNKNLEEFYLTFQENLSQEIIKTLQAWIEDGTLGEVISQLIEGRMVFQNIQALQAAPNVFKLGTVIELLGYYTAGDGAGHNRIISDSDDGSGVQVGTKWANLIKTGEVLNTYFGMKPTPFIDAASCDACWNKFVKYCNNTKQTMLIAKGSWAIYSPIITSVSIIGQEEQPTLMYVVTRDGQSNLKSFDTLDYCPADKTSLKKFTSVRSVIGVNYTTNDTEKRIQIKNLKISCTNGDSDSVAAMDHGIFIPEQNHLTIDNVLVVRPQLSGIRAFELWKSVIKNVNVWKSRTSGFEFGWNSSGTFTSLSVESCYAHGFTKHGYYLAGVQYSAFSGLAADAGTSADAILALISSHGVTINGIGCESASVGDMFYIGDSSADISGIYTLGMNIRKNIFNIFAPSQLNIGSFSDHNKSLTADSGAKIITATAEGHNIILNNLKNTYTTKNGIVMGCNISSDGGVKFLQGGSNGKYFANMVTSKDISVSGLKKGIGGLCVEYLSIGLEHKTATNQYELKPEGVPTRIISIQATPTDIPAATPPADLTFFIKWSGNIVIKTSRELTSSTERFYVTFVYEN